MFDNLIDNNKIKSDFKLILKNNDIFHTYMFIGTKGIEKS